MAPPVLIRDIMTTPVRTLPRTATVLEAAEFFLKNRLSGAPVVDDIGRVDGILTLRDLAKYFLEPAFRGTPQPLAAVHPQKLLISELMTPSPYYLRPGDLIEEAKKAMRQHKTHRMLVNDEHGKLVGILSAADLLNRVRDDY